MEEEEVAVVKAEVGPPFTSITSLLIFPHDPSLQEQSLLARIIGEETQARVIESISDWANDKARENPGCVERFVCETYRTGESLTGLPYLAMSLTK